MPNSQNIVNQYFTIASPIHIARIRTQAVRFVAVGGDNLPWKEGKIKFLAEIDNVPDKKIRLAVDKFEEHAG